MNGRLIIIQSAVLVLCVVLGFFLGWIPEYISRRKRLKAHWAALKAETDTCKEKAQGYLKDNVEAPLYRLPVLYFQTSFPVLLAEGAVKGEELPLLMDLSCQVQAVNRGLELATELYTEYGSEMRSRLHKVHARNRDYAQQVVAACVKAEEIIAPHSQQSRLWSLNTRKLCWRR